MEIDCYTTTTARFTLQASSMEELSLELTPIAENDLQLRKYNLLGTLNYTREPITSLEIRPFYQETRFITCIGISGLCSIGFGISQQALSLPLHQILPIALGASLSPFLINFALPNYFPTRIKHFGKESEGTEKVTRMIERIADSIQIKGGLERAISSIKTHTYQPPKEQGNNPRLHQVYFLNSLKSHVEMN